VSGTSGISPSDPREYDDIGKATPRLTCGHVADQRHNGMMQWRTKFQIWMAEGSGMKAFLFVVGAFAVLLALQPAPADARSNSYCLRRAGSIGPGRCDFSTRQQCMRIASASNATCSRNSRSFHHSPSRTRGGVWN
jgi:hypothetical protein